MPFSFLVPLLEPRLPLLCPDDQELGGWYLTPNHHLIEFFAINGVCLFLLTHAINQLRKTKHKKNKTSDNNSSNGTHSNTLSEESSELDSSLPSSLHHRRHLAHEVDPFLLIVLSISLITVVIHKILEDRVWFLLQPCHVMHALLLLLVVLPPSSPSGTFIFNLYLHLLFGPFLGLVAADTSCYTQLFELENWLAQHILLLVIPLFFIFTYRFPLIRGWPFFVLSISIQILYHYFILTIVSIWSGMNLNYVLCPPGGVLSQFGKFYRIAMISFCILLSVGLRYGLIEGFRWAIGQHKKEAELERQALHTERNRNTAAASSSSSNGVEANGGHPGDTDRESTGKAKANGALKQRKTPKVE